MQGGEDIELTNENKAEYVRLSCTQRLVTSIRPQVFFFFILLKPRVE
jgi:hypothetical protein